MYACGLVVVSGVVRAGSMIKTIEGDLHGLNNVLMVDNTVDELRLQTTDNSLCQITGVLEAVWTVFEAGIEADGQLDRQKRL